MPSNLQMYVPEPEPVVEEPVVPEEPAVEETGGEGAETLAQPVEDNTPAPGEQDQQLPSGTQEVQ